ncbi:alanyl-tRNA editing protein [Chengkuizengella axinellae]|uniref:Alanine--tRNA ligase-related protein n=1 Tax=Chengkuizengella axinellae TaxID=3064388 RepID=A0ABT9J4S1_9BACL|nr:alanine--tRNA ligase-related protein [Chengkuizengella sp. 2205SS18-9]MDP5276608.1 alanine--tRNA ligase-related protein [Chengkuizengella sp. 2205SS18-9]
MSNKLYYSNPFLKSWKTNIKEIREENNRFILQLEETAFYPEGGGQPSDIGSINGVKVIDVQEKEDLIYHLVDRLPEENTVSCEIDWKRRFDHMQHHSGQHLLSAVCIELYDVHTMSFHLGADTVTIDLNVKQLSNRQLDHIEHQANLYIYENRPIKSYMVAKEELSKLPLRKIPDVEDNIRIVEINGIDTSACCGTHVESTGQIGIIKCLKTEKHKGGVRLYFKCGFRALKDYGQTHQVLMSTGAKLNANRDTLPSRIEQMEMEQKQLQKELSETKEKLFSSLGQELLKEQKNNGLIVRYFDDYTMKDLQLITKAIFTEKEGMTILVSNTEKRILLAQSGGFSLDCGAILKEHLKQFEGKGGGSKVQGQAMFKTEEQLVGFVNLIEKTLLS